MDSWLTYLLLAFIVLVLVSNMVLLKRLRSLGVEIEAYRNEVQLSTHARQNGMRAHTQSRKDPAVDFKPRTTQVHQPTRGGRMGQAVERKRSNGLNSDR